MRRRCDCQAWASYSKSPRCSKTRSSGKQAGCRNTSSIVGSSTTITKGLGSLKSETLTDLPSLPVAQVRDLIAARGGKLAVENAAADEADEAAKEQRIVEEAEAIMKKRAQRLAATAATGATAGAARPGAVECAAAGGRGASQAGICAAGGAAGGGQQEAAEAAEAGWEASGQPGGMLPGELQRWHDASDQGLEQRLADKEQVRQQILV